MTLRYELGLLEKDRIVTPIGIISTEALPRKGDLYLFFNKAIISQKEYFKVVDIIYEANIDENKSEEIEGRVVIGLPKVIISEIDNPSYRFKKNQANTPL